MSFSSLLEKIALGETLTAAERQDLVLEARRAEQAVSLLNSIIKPGTQVLRVDTLEASNVTIDNGDIVMDDNSITVDVGGGFIVIDTEGITLDNDVGFLRFKDSNGDVKFGIYAKFNDALNISNDIPGKEIIINATTTDGNVLDLQLAEDAGAANRGHLNLGLSANGSKMGIGGAVVLNAEGASGHWTGIALDLSSTPTTPDAAHVHVYLKSNKLVFQYLDGGSVRYKYLDLTGTGVTWVATTTAP